MTVFRTNKEVSSIKSTCYKMVRSFSFCSGAEMEDTAGVGLSFFIHTTKDSFWTISKQFLESYFLSFSFKVFVALVAFIQRWETKEGGQRENRGDMQQRVARARSQTRNHSLCIWAAWTNHCNTRAAQFLDSFWTVSEQFLNSFWTVSTQFLDSFWTVSGKFLDSFWTVC